ncbi:MAG TPA: hypothetical protein VGD66_13270 [Allosphingosinicella sp.]
MGTEGDEAGEQGLPRGGEPPRRDEPPLPEDGYRDACRRYARLAGRRRG